MSNTSNIINNSSLPLPPSLSSSKSFNKFILVASPRKFKIRYRKKNGEVKDYKITVIDVDNDGFVGYAYGRGIRRFKEEGILDMKAE